MNHKKKFQYQKRIKIQVKVNKEDVIFERVKNRLRYQRLFWPGSP